MDDDADDADDVKGSHPVSKRCSTSLRPCQRRFWNCMMRLGR